MEKRYNYTAQETEQREFWNQNAIYGVQPDDQRPLYAIDTPPPTVSGSLHIGHIFSYTQTDIIARYKRMSGFRVFYPFGFDDNGLPTERYIEKKHKVRAHELGRKAFIEFCLQQTKEIESEFMSLWQLMGLSVDWNYSYATISPVVRTISQASFIDLYKKGFIYRKLDPALYCTTCQTAVAQAELDTFERESVFYTLAFQDMQSQDLLISTTRPELLSSCVALFYHPDDTRYQYLAGQHARVPVFGNFVPILSDVNVQPDKGTGLVMCCTFGDKTDIYWYKTYQLPYRESITIRGRWKEHTGILAGLNTVQARDTIIQALRTQGVLKSQTAVTQHVSIHERCKNPIEYIMLWQWFLRLLDHKQTFIELADRIAWYPAFMKMRYINWVENLDWDWCLSRQRYYGIPFPVWHCQTCNTVIVAQENELPLDPQDIQKICITCNQIAQPDADIMDTWNTSSLTPYICKQLYTNQPIDFASQSFLPMAMRPQAHDIIRTWAFYTIVKTWLHAQGLPWESIVISGHVLSEKEEKISKSQEHKTLSPAHLLNQYPADALRYWTAATTLGYDTPFSAEQLKNGQKLITKLWNAFLFIKEHARKPMQESYGEYSTENQWVFGHAHQTETLYQRAFNSYEFGAALQSVEQFFWNIFCDNYLEMIKDQLFKSDKYDAKQVQQTRETLYAIGFHILQWYAPYVPYVTEAIYRDIYADDMQVASIHQTGWKQTDASACSDEARIQMDLILSIITTMRKLKSAQQLALNTPIHTLTIYGAHDVYAAVRYNELLLKGVTHAHNILYSTQNIETSFLEQRDGMWSAHIVLMQE